MSVLGAVFLLGSCRAEVIEGYAHYPSKDRFDPKTQDQVSFCASLGRIASAHVYRQPRSVRVHVCVCAYARANVYVCGSFRLYEHRGVPYKLVCMRRACVRARVWCGAARRGFRNLCVLLACIAIF